APGYHMVSANLGDPPYRPVRGTSYAAPIVAGLLAPALPRPDRQRARAAVDALARQAGGGTTVSNAIGHGIVGADLRVDPARLR
ncbi:MAG: S8 family serine peptidase, partial [Ramlibacter sp.]